MLKDTPPDTQDQTGAGGGGSAPAGTSNDDPLSIARAAFNASTNWLNTGVRRNVDNSIRAFQSQHPSGSKYYGEEYKFRSQIFRPKTRSLVTKAEAACAAAYFSTAQVIDIQPEDDGDDLRVAAAKAMQALIQYRLTKTIPWFLTVCGGYQDALVTGVPIAKVHWRTEKKKVGSSKQPVMNPLAPEQPLTDPATGEAMEEDVPVYDLVKDEPAIDLMPFENLRIAPGADWRDPVNSSPVLIAMFPMFVVDVKARMASVDDKTGQRPWKHLDDAALLRARTGDNDVTRRVRERDRAESKDANQGVRDFDIVWVHENFVRREDGDVTFWSLGTDAYLSDPIPIEEAYWHGLRPYVMGYAAIETHKTYPTSKVQQNWPLQQLTNDLTNLSLDGARLALNPRMKVRAGKRISLEQIRRFMPGQPIFMENPETDLIWEKPPDVSRGVYEERDRANVDLDENFGGFSQGTVQADRGLHETVGGMRMMEAAAGSVGEYSLRIYTETFVEQLVRHLVKLESAYESDETVLAIAGQNARIDKLGYHGVTPEMLQQEMTVRVNVGIGATDPTQKLQRFMMAAGAIGQIFGPQAAQFAKPKEIADEVFGFVGYRDAARFLQLEPDPKQQMLEQENEQLKGELESKQAEQQTKIQTAQISAEPAMLKAQNETGLKEIDLQIKLAEFQFKTAEFDFKREQMMHERVKMEFDLRKTAVEASRPPEPPPQRAAA